MSKKAVILEIYIKDEGILYDFLYFINYIFDRPLPDLPAEYVHECGIPAIGAVKRTAAWLSSY
jgi:hypothetical protein